MKRARASFRTVRGQVASQWALWGKTLVLDATIPIGSAAQIRIPLGKLEQFEVVEGDGKKTVWKDNAYVDGVEGVTGAEVEDRTAIVRVEAGTYKFTVKEIDEQSA